MRTRTLSLLLALSCLGVAAPAQTGGPRAREANGPAVKRAGAQQAAPRAPAVTPGDLLLPTLDRDGDGALTGLEIDMAVVSLRALDRDRDGTVSASEMTSRPAPAPAPAQKGPANRAPKNPFQDTDGDGSITANDLAPALRAQFPMLDKNGDGVLDDEEQAGAVKEAQGRKPAGGEVQGARGKKADDATGEGGAGF